jgi:hypothetical protein
VCMNVEAWTSAPVSILTPEDRKVLERAHEHLEHPSLAARVTSVVGTPIEIGLALMPRRWYKRIHGIAEALIARALDTAISSLRHRPDVAHPHFYQALVAVSGAAGGAFGLLGMPAEMGVSTTIMLRSIADIARSEGEDLDTPESRLACLEVFALGGRTEEDDAADTGYYGLRLALSLPVSTAAYHVARKGLVVGDGAPFLVELIHGVASRFGIALSEKAAFYTLPVIGAATGATINMIFLHHFQEMARSHFAVRRLERKYGADVVRAAYETLT